MSGFSNETECPNCGNNADEYTDWKPFNYTSIQCLHCGLLISPQISYLTLKDLNNLRKDSELKLLRKKPEQNKNLW